MAWYDAAMNTIKELIQVTGLSNKQVAYLMGDTEPNISRLRKGHRKETHKHIALIRFIQYLHERKLLDRYIRWREAL